MSNELIEGMAGTIANEILGLQLGELAPDRGEQRKWHRDGRVLDINQPTREEVLCAARAVIKRLADPDNITPEMVEAAIAEYEKAEGIFVAGIVSLSIAERSAVFKYIIAAALKAAMEE